MDDLAADRAWFAARALRRQLDRAIGRAMIDEVYARQLLADPSMALGEASCTPAQRVQLSQLGPSSVPELAAALVDQFWGVPLLAPISVRELAEVS